MNYLAHLLLAGEDGPFLVGNLMGDFVRGRPEGLDLPGDVVAGIRLHRHIDVESDRHPAGLRARDVFHGRARRVAGIATDVVFDHMLARHWLRFARTPLPTFAAHCYATLYRHRATLPPRLDALLPRMAGDDWLTAYADPATPARALAAMGRRFRQPDRLREAAAQLRGHDVELEAAFLDLFPALMEEATAWRRRHRVGPPGAEGLH